MMVAIFMTVTPPMPFALMPFFALALHNVCHALKQSAPKLPAFVGSRIAYVASEEGSLHVQSFGAISEVVVAAMSPLLVLLHGMRMGFLAFIYFQYVVRRYRTNFMTKQAVGIFAEKIDSLAAHRWNTVHFLQQIKGLDLRDLTRDQFDHFGSLVDRSFQVPRELQDMHTVANVS